MLTYVFIIFLDLIYLCTAKYGKEITKSSIGCIHSLALFPSRCRKDLLRNTKDEIILEVFKSKHLQAFEEEYWRLGGRFAKK